MWQTNLSPIWHQISLVKPAFEEFIDPSKIIYQLENEGGQLRIFAFPEHDDEKKQIGSADVTKLLAYLKTSTNFPQEYKDFMDGASRTLYVRIEAFARRVFLARIQ
jgi:hypothetical protein